MNSHMEENPTRTPRKGTGDPLGHAIRYGNGQARPVGGRTDRVATSHDLGTEQGIFDHVVDAILAQGTRAPDSSVLEHRETLTGDGLTSVYRGMRLRSPIGFLVTDAAYGDDLELLHLYSWAPDGRYPLIDALDPRIPRDRSAMTLIWMLQMAHDNPRTRSAVTDWRSKWKQVMAQMATTLNLDAASLDQQWIPTFSKAA